MEIRTPKKSDQEDTEKCLQLIEELSQEYPEVEGAMWSSACISLYARSFHINDFSYEDFCYDLEEAKKFYKHLWEEDGVD